MVTNPAYTATTRNPSFSLQWESDESTKHYHTKMLLVINWRNWQAGKYSRMRIKVHVSALHWNPPGYIKVFFFVIWVFFQFVGIIASSQKICYFCCSRVFCWNILPRWLFVLSDCLKLQSLLNYSIEWEALWRLIKFKNP